MSNSLPWMEGFMKMQMLREAIASVSLSHEEGCRCTTCRAALGDEEAFLEIVLAMREKE